jgi:site-specific DNA-methyltransferase (adenine-specific)
MTAMAQFPDKYFELAIVDPPYGLPKDSTHGRGKLKNRILNNGSLELWDRKPTHEYFEELFRVSKNQIIWGGNYFDLPPARCVVVWDKCQPWENFSQVEIAWTSFGLNARLFKYDNRTGNKIHPTQKPVALYKWLLKNYAKQGDKILDTHMGSGSSIIACYDMGFDYMAFEIDKDYFDMANERIEAHKAQGRLFVDELKTEAVQETIELY